MAERIDLGSVSYVLGILSIVFAFMSPFAGLIFGIVGVVQSNRAKSKRSKRLNIIGIILSVIFIILSIIAIIYSAGAASSLFPSI